MVALDKLPQGEGLDDVRPRTRRSRGHGRPRLVVGWQVGRGGVPFIGGALPILCGGTGPYEKATLRFIGARNVTVVSLQ